MEGFSSKRVASRQGRELKINLRDFSGAQARRAVYTGAMRLGAHAHDWPSLVLHVLGGYRERNESGEMTIARPAAVLHPRQIGHEEIFEDGGAEFVILQFDPHWLGLRGKAADLGAARCWTYGVTAGLVRTLARAWSNPALSEQDLRRITAAFLETAMRHSETKCPRWLSHVELALSQANPPTTTALARKLDMHEAWLARAYRVATGEGLQETLRRRKAERAIKLLRSSGSPLAEIAFTAGFCDQSHMNRVVLEFTGRTPCEIRHEAQRSAHNELH